jgi:hypothetical protein
MQINSNSFVSVTVWSILLMQLSAADVKYKANKEQM